MRLVRASLAALLIVLALAPAAVLAQGPLELATPFPAVVADPGATAKFAVTVTTDTSQRVDLTVATSPPNWTTTLRGGGSTIAAVYTLPDPEVVGEISADLSADVEIPDDAAAGSYEVEIEARSAAGLTAQLTLDITIEEQAGGSVQLQSDFPSLSGSPDDSFRFDLELRNGSNQQITIGLEAVGPPGWDIDARPSGTEQATTAVVDAGGLSAVRVTVTPPRDAPADTYPITVSAVGGPQPAQVELAVEITGSYDMDLATSDDRQSGNITVGTPTSLTIVVTNTGSAPLTNVTLSATPPREWDVTFASETIAQIQPQEEVPVEVSIQAANNAVAGDYVVTVRASSEEASADPVELRMTVETSPIGGLLGIGVLLLVAVGLFFVFQRYGRR